MVPIVVISGAVLRQFGHAQESIDLLECTGRETFLQIAMHLGDLAKFGGVENESEIGFAAAAGGGGVFGKRRRGFALKKCFQSGKSFEALCQANSASSYPKIAS